MDRQICWLDSFDPSEVVRNFQIERAPKGGKTITRLVWSPLIAVCRTHWRGRTQPCTWPNCEDCDKGAIPEVKGFLLTIVPNTEEKRLTEFTASPAATLKEYQDRNGQLHGIAIEIGRKNDRDNGPVYVRIKAENLSLAKFGLPPDIRPILETMWRFSPDAKATADASRARRELANGEIPTPAAGPIATTNGQVSKLKKGPAKRS